VVPQRYSRALAHLELGGRYVFAQSEPDERVEWAGPTMSVRSSITARLMEIWSHAQAIYDVFGVVRKNEDRIKNIVVLGVNTYGWTFKNRGVTPPEPTPYIVLCAPSGDKWTFNSPSDSNIISGSATEFCQVVTQVRNIRDTQLNVRDNNAQAWMEIAQCFAGPPEAPPTPGSRFVTVAGASNSMFVIP